MTFYDLEGKVIDRGEFILQYSKRYYLNSDPTYYETPKRKNNRVLQCSPYIEKEMDKLLQKGITDEGEVMRILAWKIGKIKHRESEVKNAFIYAKDWDGCEKSLKIHRFKEIIDYEYLVGDIVNNIVNLELTSKSDPWEAFSFISEEGHKGIGTVYLFTLLYFISRGEIQIYDKYAHIALDAIKNNKKPGEFVPYKSLPDRKSELSIIRDEYENNYEVKLGEIFGEAYKRKRDIDRALWVYGHLFPNKKGEQPLCS